eukprot:TRINITY_DN1543_c0_g2_i4.p1 TRINITY_DN1543_c0_g2~~TRINITY_DN1543_c0_g2_i4.p1  ORF type:complete len:510 (+),score=58.62 TRINITY_DN1543_c0_g2_i4:85-1614(+)
MTESGCLTEYTPPLHCCSPDAVNWWHAQMDAVLDIGLDGWKCDGTDPYVLELIPPLSKLGILDRVQYSDFYYRDFYYYTKSKNPDALIMSRPVDGLGYGVFMNFSPRDVVFSGWVGDQDPTFDGLKDALKNMFQSAWNKYVNFGSDVGGYRLGNHTTEVFTRWFQLGAFCPLFENGGEDRHAPWQFDNDTVTTYRTFVQFHDALLPYFLSTGNAAWYNGTSSMTPLAEPSQWEPDTWDYFLGTDIVVCPMVDDSLQRNISFPNHTVQSWMMSPTVSWPLPHLSGSVFTSNNTVQWIDWWDHNTTYPGGTDVMYDVPTTQFPVFVRSGALVPLLLKQGVKLGGGFSDFPVVTNVHNSLMALTIMKPRIGDEHVVPIYAWKKAGQHVQYAMTENRITFAATPHSRRLLIVIRGVRLRSEVTVTQYAIRQGNNDTGCHSQDLNLGRESVPRVSTSVLQQQLEDGVCAASGCYSVHAASLWIYPQTYYSLSDGMVQIPRKVWVEVDGVATTSA